MKLTSIITIFASTMAAVSAVPMADPIPVVDLDLAAIPNPHLEARDLSAAECKAACAEGAQAMQRFCRRLPPLAKQLRFFCWGAATAVESPLGQTACVVFCDAWF